MIPKRLIEPQRRRKVPRQFSWVDHRLVQHGYIQRCSHAAWTLYLLLVTVGDAEGLSYYGERTLCKRLSMNESELAAARGQLIKAGLIAFRPPLYQVLSLEEPVASSQRSSGPSGEPKAFGEILRDLMGGAP